MIETKCECCGGKVLKPDPPGKTPLERIQFEKDWDKRYEERKANVI
jgi:hypothetical protein